MEQKNFNVPASHLILMKDNKILLLNRFNTGYRDGDYGVIAGHVEKGENFTDAMIREAKEEVGITVSRQQLKVVHVQHKTAIDYVNDRVHTYFLATEWEGDIQNMEINKCSDLSWFDINNLPKNMLDCVRAAIENIKNKIFYSEFGR